MLFSAVALALPLYVALPAAFASLGPQDPTEQEVVLEEIEAILAEAVETDDPERKLALADRLLGIATFSAAGLTTGHYLRGAALEELGRPADAEAAFSEAIQHDPENELALYGLAGLAQKRGDMAEVARLCAEVCRFQPMSALAHERLGNAWLMGLRYDEARTAFQKACSLDVNHAGGFVGAGLLALMEDDIVTAAQMYIPAEHNSGGEEGRFGTFKEGLFKIADEEALGMARAVAYDGRTVDAWRTLIQYCHRQGELQLGFMAAHTWGRTDGPERMQREAALAETVFLSMGGARARAAATLRRYLEATGWRDLEAGLIYHRLLESMGFPVSAEVTLVGMLGHAVDRESWHYHLAEFALGRRERDDMEGPVWEASGIDAQARYVELDFFRADEAFDLAQHRETLDEMSNHSWLADRVRLIESLNQDHERVFSEGTDDVVDALPDGARIVLPPGVMTLQTPLKLNGRRQLTIVGRNPLVDGEWQGDPSRLSFELKLPYAACVSLEDCSGVTFENIEWVNQDGDTRPLMDAQRCPGLALSHCRIVNGGPALQVSEGQGLWISGCYFSVSEEPIRLESVDGLTLQECHFQHPGTRVETKGLTGQLVQRHNRTPDGYLVLK